MYCIFCINQMTLTIGFFLFKAEVVGATEKGEVNIYAPDQVSHFNHIYNQRGGKRKD